MRGEQGFGGFWFVIVESTAAGSGTGAGSKAFFLLLHMRLAVCLSFMTTMLSCTVFMAMPQMHNAAHI